MSPQPSPYWHGREEGRNAKGQKTIRELSKSPVRVLVTADQYKLGLEVTDGRGTGRHAIPPIPYQVSSWMLGGRCSFLDSDPLGGPLVQSSGESSSSTPQASASAQSPEQKSDSLNLYDEELIRRWSEVTCFTMDDRHEVFPMWQVTVPGLALNQPFLKHGLLALAAMHIRYTSPLPLQTKYLDLASQHQDRALEGYIPQLQDITPENYHALFAFSALLLAIQYSFISVLDGEIDSHKYVAEVISVFEYVIGATVIAFEGEVWLRQGGMKPLMERGTEPQSILPELIEDPRTVLGSLLSYLRHLDEKPGPSSETETTANMPIYVRSIEMLTNAFPTEDSERRMLDDMIGWPHYVGADLVRLLRAQDQMALVILAHYGVALDAFTDIWWLEGVGARLVHGIARMLPVEFIPLVQWPLDKVSTGASMKHMYII
ncbi:uncharacterized protein Z519_02524 [Cladophialophora bantiana CBS 173.52]|uniref:Transcription factor domain-containing protein n=1 Tax=Cladophialophora bantiana (strain ATCC 10958 / CBS 173.52 / CDC B-1940 / NIH 8579) TaxID=1442370 RepID=A0A0D2GFI6_CLAB1|nr:uncharacterized protein Z519_02524 [Cladophialophora bantiana CBS 173.52]KIW97132.1 hypothetical protein Z519_02524 [Cladophialophora bantiana CBS 173.52]